MARVGSSPPAAAAAAPRPSRLDEDGAEVEVEDESRVEAGELAAEAPVAEAADGRRPPRPPTAEAAEPRGDRARRAETAAWPTCCRTPTEPDDLERQLTQDEEMERQNRHQHHEAPHFRKESD